VAELDLSYPGILEHFSGHMAPGRSESRAFLAWFLEHYYRLEELSAQDAVCDGPDDKGIDGIYVDDNLERVDVFQARLIQSATRTIGERPLRELVGALDQLASGAAVDHLVTTTGNIELKRLIESEGVADKIVAGYEVRGVFVTNVPAGADAVRYVAGNGRVEMFDAGVLRSGFVPTGPSLPVDKPVHFDVSGFDVIEYRTLDATVLVAALLATELMVLDGIQTGELFDWNVRRSLGRTKVNRAIAQSVKDQAEHRNFLLYHNGLTVLTTDMEYAEDRITISGYSVVNGCQSLTSLYENRSSISTDLRLLGRIIQLPPDSDLAARITHHSNNQNAISARDLQSNSTLQRRLQQEFAARYPNLFFEIKRGEETVAGETLTNETAARMLLAFDIQQPWSCHQTYKLFDELYGDIFGRPEVTADRIVGLHLAHKAIVSSLDKVENGPLATYRLLEFTLLYLLRRALHTDAVGQQFVQRPERFVSEPGGEQRLLQCFKVIIADLIVDLNAEVAARNASADPFDYKRELKSPQAVRKLEQAIIPMYQKAVVRRRASAFGEEWAASVATSSEA
jgi:hypothetical protein